MDKDLLVRSAKEIEGAVRPIRSAWTIGLPFGTALGVLYSVTTISGPPLAILFNNQGLVKNEFPPILCSACRRKLRKSWG
jgi:hypothetical protein